MKKVFTCVLTCLWVLAVGAFWLPITFLESIGPKGEHKNIFPIISVIFGVLLLMFSLPLVLILVFPEDLSYARIVFLLTMVYLIGAFITHLVARHYRIRCLLWDPEKKIMSCS